MATKIDQKSYLQKYLGGPSVDKKKRKKKATKGKGFKIIDDDIDLSKLRALDGDELDVFDEGEDAPQIAGIIDDRPEEVKLLDQLKTSSKWKVINQDDGFSSKLQIEEIKKDVKETEKENELIFGKMYSDSEDEKKNDSDVSPPRKQSNDKQKKSETSKKHDSDSDFSPPRKRDGRSPPRPTKSKEKVRKPSRWGEKDEMTEYSNDATTFQNRNPSPARPYLRRSNSSDISPPRKSKKYRNSSKTRKQRHSSGSDLSPPRKNKRKSPSPIRKVRKSPDRGKRRNNSDSDQSPPRRERNKDMYERGRNKRTNDSPPPSNKKMARTLEGKMAGLQDARQLRQENDEFRKREDEVFNKMSDEVSGRNAKAVSRKSKRETSEERSKLKEKAERQKEIDEKYKKWSRGLKQLEDQESRVQEFMHEASKPLARHKNDRDLESNLKQVERAGDPMLQYIKDKKRERGELGPEKPSYKGSFPPNRFNIRPGYRWDGVDRSNGYEKKYFDQQSKRKAQEEEAYKWSTEDL